MWNGRKNRRRATDGFTLVELLAVIVILGLLLSIAIPGYRAIMAKAESVHCGNQLKNIGAATQLLVQDNNGRVPCIEPDPVNPIYASEDNAMTIMDAFKPYGLEGEAFLCRSDHRRTKNFQSKGTSYEWLPMVNGESPDNARILWRFGFINVSPVRLPLCGDFAPLHNGGRNIVFADGRVRMY
jgi:prepilin-type N-terminal cleavage/methylation domain-containing protein/prepilin-type processing-associated H-X9-DG protein